MFLQKLHDLTISKILIDKFSKVYALTIANKRYLLYKYLPTSLMFLLSAYIYSLLRGVKDSILVPKLGAELISFVKFYGVFPSTLIFFICFAKLANILSRDKLYYFIILFFISFFLSYAFIFNVHQEFFTLDLTWLKTKFPSFKYQLLMIEHWTVSLFYIMSELCGTVILTLLFWQLANDLYNIQEAKKTYAFFGLIGQTGLVLAGLVQHKISLNYDLESNSLVAWNLTIKWLMGSIAISGAGLILIYHWLYNNILNNQEFCDRKHNSDREKIKLSLKESFKYLFSSKYLWLIMVIVFCYGFGINLVESVWKDQLRKMEATQNGYSVFIGQFHIYFGFSTIFMMLVGAYVLRTYKWLIVALLTPIGAGITGIIFFSMIIAQNSLGFIPEFFKTNILTVAILAGCLQVIIFKSFNYSFVDPTKEMAFIPLDRELRTKGKAAVDVVGGRFGKSFGAIVQQFMFIFISPNISDLTIPIFIIFVLVMLIWSISVFALNNEFIKISESNDKSS